VASDPLTWIDSPTYAEFGWPSGPTSRFRVGDVEFRCEFGESHDRVFSIRKDRVRIEEYLNIVERFKTDNFVELGIGSGGSVALTALVAPPRKLVALDLGPDRVDALDKLIAERDLSERVRLHYGADQADRQRLMSILDDEFGNEPLGLVVDDASHRLDETRASFEVLFPRLRPGGLFVIEDWNHQQLISRDLAAALADPSPELKARILRRIAEGPRIAYRYMKENFNRSMNGDLLECMDMEAAHHQRSGQTEDHREAARAFAEKRPPTFNNR